jgi:hypothetical protein
MEFFRQAAEEFLVADMLGSFDLLMQPLPFGFYLFILQALYTITDYLFPVRFRGQRILR